MKIEVKEEKELVALDKETLAMYAAMEDDGFENMTGEQISIPMLKVCQPTSTAAKQAGVNDGEFYNSDTMESFGPKVHLIVAHFDITWVEWKPDLGGFVGRHAPNSVKYEGNPYDGMYVVDDTISKYSVTKDGVQVLNWNKLEETYVYFVILADHPELGYFCYNGSAGNIKYLKKWNTSMHMLRLPNGAKAALFAGIWEIETFYNAARSGKGGGYHFGANGKPLITFAGYVNKPFFVNYIEPIRAQRVQLMERVKYEAEPINVTPATDIDDIDDPSTF